MNATDLNPIRAGVEQRFAAVESLIPPMPAWRTASDHDIRPTLVRVGAGPTFRSRPARPRSFGLLLVVAAVVLTLAYGLAGGVGQPSTVPPEHTPSATPTAAPTMSPSPGELRPAIDRRLIFPVRPETAWTLVEDGAEALRLVYLLDDVGTLGYNVGLLAIMPVAVYDPVVETKRLPLPPDLVGWIRDHPDLDSGEPSRLTVAGRPATAIDVTVTYPADGPKGQTAQFIDIGSVSVNLEFGLKERIVLVELPDRPLLIIFESRPEFFDAGVEYFEDELALIQFEDGGPAP